MLYYLFLDDQRLPKDITWSDLPAANWIIVRNYEQFVNYIKTNGIPEYITFDHDLSFEHYPITKPQTGDIIDYTKFKEKTGYDCAKWLIDYCINNNNIKLPKWNVHSMNPIGRENIFYLLVNFNIFQQRKV